MNPKTKTTVIGSLALAFALPLVLQGCEGGGSGSSSGGTSGSTSSGTSGASGASGGTSGTTSPLSCNEFKVGATINADIGGSAASQVAVQAVADYAGIALTAVEDVTTLCRGITQDLGTASTAQQQTAEASADKRAKMNAWCSLAVTAIGTVKASAGGTLQIVTKAPTCATSVLSKATCQAKCAGSAQCDLKANPVKCTGGKLEILCKGGCTAQSGATVACEGKCEANCEGSCLAGPGGVACAGKCLGSCTAGAAGSGIQADGTCNGTCQGTCDVTAPNSACNGSCDGKCSGACKAVAGGSVTCDGACDGDFDPIRCEAGKLEGGCQVEARCDANCDVIVTSKAECTTPAIVVSFAGAANLEAAGKLARTLRSNLGMLLMLKSRLQGMAVLSTTLTGNASSIADIKAACIPVVVATAASSVGDVTAVLSATTALANAAGT